MPAPWWDWPFPTELLGKESQTLVDFRGKSPMVLQPEGDWRLIHHGQRVELCLGPFRIRTALEDFNDETRSWSQLQCDLRPYLSWLGSAAAQLALLLATYYAIPELTNIEPLPQDGSLAYAIVPTLEDAESEPSEDEELPGVATSDQRYLKHTNGEATRCAGYGMGNRAAPKVNARYAVAGPKDNPDPHIARTVALKKLNRPPADSLGTISVGSPEEPRSPFAPWGRDSSLGTDELSARGNMWGDRQDDALGADDLAEPEVSGGLFKRIEISRKPTQQQRLPARVIHSQLSVWGAMQSGDAESVLAPMLPAFRECYRASPSSLGSEEGHLELGLTIEPTGKVSDVNAIRTERIEATLMSCVVERARAIRFPNQDASSHLTYPLHFIPGIAPSSPPLRTIPLAPAIQHEIYTFSPCSGKRPGEPKILQPCSR